MGILFSSCASTTEIKVLPARGGQSDISDVLNTTFYPPITPCKPDNPWLPLLTPSQLVEIHTNFKKFDRDGDGHIEPKEIHKVMRNLGIAHTEEKVQELIASVDTDGNGMIEFDEFLSITASNMLRNDGKKELEQAFALFQPKGVPEEKAKLVDLQLVRSYLTKCGSRKLSTEEIDQMLASLQPDADGCVPLEQFSELRCWDIPPPPRPAGVPAPASSSSGVPSSGA